ncbi:MAG TPA: hypothetical protein DCX60_10960, partial [Phycisphaerales bacterium]|nr:hypothetical protein [Phycisphaerales bacterium]
MSVKSSSASGNWPLFFAVCVPLILFLQTTFGQVRSVVMVDDSPTAELLLQRAIEQASENPGEAARLCAEVIDDYGTRLVADTTNSGLFHMARIRAEELLLAMPEVRSRFVEIREPLAARLLAENRDDEAARLAWVTPSGGEAALRLVQRDLETFKLSSARRVLARLDRHPLLGQRAVLHLTFMNGMVARLAGDSASSIEHEAILESMEGGDRLRNYLHSMSLAADPDRNQPADAYESMADPMAPGAWHRIWRADVEATPLGLQRISSSGSIDNQDVLLESTRSGGNLLIINPLVTDDAVFVNDGTSIRRYDRYGDRLEWSHESVRSPRRSAGDFIDLSGLDSDGRILVALSGLGMATRRTASPEVIGLDAIDGSLLWATRIDQCDFSSTPSSGGRAFNLTNAFPYAGPLIDCDKVIIPVRRVVAATRESIDYLIALDLESGRPAWIRLLGSSGSLQVARGFSRTILADGKAITASPLGTISCVDSSTGDLLWLRKFEVDGERSGIVSKPWEISQPVVIDEILIALSPNGREVVSIDIVSGSILDSWPSGVGTRFGDVRYLLSGTNGDEDLLLAVGEDIHALNPADDFSLRWRYSDSARDENASREGITVRTGMRGRVQAGQGRVLVPGVNDLFIVNADDGRVLDIIKTGEPSNPVLAGSEIVLGESESVSALMQLDPARLLLRRQIS